MDSLKSENSSLEAELTRLKEYKADLTNKFNRLSNECGRLRKEVKTLKSEKPDPNEPSKNGLQNKNLKVLDVILKCFGVFVALPFIKECLSDHYYYD